VVSGRAKGNVFELTESSEITIGRAGTCDITILDPSMSRTHAAFTHGANGFTIRDRGSANGILVNNKKLKDADLNEGDTIDLGETKLVFHVESGYEEAKTDKISKEKQAELAEESKLAEAEKARSEQKKEAEKSAASPQAETPPAAKLPQEDAVKTGRITAETSAEEVSQLAAKLAQEITGETPALPDSDTEQKSEKAPEKDEKKINPLKEAKTSPGDSDSKLIKNNDSEPKTPEKVDIPNPTRATIPVGVLDDGDEFATDALILPESLLGDSTPSPAEGKAKGSVRVPVKEPVGLSDKTSATQALSKFMQDFNNNDSDMPIDEDGLPDLPEEKRKMIFGEDSETPKPGHNRPVS
jgi:pSer/pThr/pTyr-binding forkhead associated (FHA) protein